MQPQIVQPTKNISQKIANFIYYLISVVFHPLFVPLMVASFLIYLHPQVYVGYNNFLKFSYIRMVTFNTLALPLLTVVVMKLLGFLKSLEVKSGRERMVVIIATMLFYFWIHYVFANQNHPKIAIQYFLSVFLTLPSALIATNFLRVSLHSMAWGNVVAFFISLALQYSFNIGLVIALVMLIAGFVATARLQLNQHTNHEIYWGFAVGIGCQIAAYFIM